MIVFLDLEETLIDNWENGWLLPTNIATIKKAIGPANPKLGLMSWAVWDDKDKAKFNSDLRPELEEALGMAFDDEFVWSMDDWAKQLLEFRGKKISREDLFDIFGKEEVLFMVARCHPKMRHQNVILIDDVVEHNLALVAKANNCLVTILNIDCMIGYDA